MTFDEWAQDKDLWPFEVAMCRESLEAGELVFDEEKWDELYQGRLETFMIHGHHALEPCDVLCEFRGIYEDD